jgi:hypothetical protein
MASTGRVCPNSTVEPNRPETRWMQVHRDFCSRLAVRKASSEWQGQALIRGPIQCSSVFLCSVVSVGTAGCVENCQKVDRLSAQTRELASQCASATGTNSEVRLADIESFASASGFRFKSDVCGHCATRLRYQRFGRALARRCN